jgi:excisionase family DNA binding protein
MRPGTPFGPGTRMLTLDELCEWLNITERHARKLVERDAIPYRKVGRLLRFVESEVEEWSRPATRPGALPRGVSTARDFGKAKALSRQAGAAKVPD